MSLPGRDQPPVAPPEALDDAPDGADAPEPAREALRRRTVVALVAMFLVIAVGSLMSLVHLPYAVLRPGPVTNILGKTEDGKPVIEVTGTQTYPTDGTLDFTTVVVYGGPNHPVNAWRVLTSLVDQSSQVLPEEVMFPKGTTGKQVEAANQAMMTDSQEEAAAVAFRAAGQQVPEVVTVATVQDDAPSGDVLKEGDVILAVDGKAVSGSADVRAAVQAVKAGDPVRLTIKRDGKESTVTAKTGSADGRTVLGVLLRVTFDVPATVTFHAGDVGGPSAGLMFSLGIYDLITPGKLTGGKDIAGTGTIVSTGEVGPIGGIRQKLVGARDGGADYFLAPASNCNEVVDHVPDGLQVVRVATFDEARTAVQSIAAGTTKSLPTCSATTSAAK